MYISATTTVTPPAAVAIATTGESAGESAAESSTDSADDPPSDKAPPPWGVAGVPPEPSTEAAPLAPFMRTLGHALRNVMGTIAVSVEVLRSGAGGKEASRSALDILDRQTARLEGVMSTALDLARALEGQLTLSPRRIELGNLVAQVIAGLPSKCPGLTLHAVQPAWVDADPIYMAQAIKSLCAATLCGTPATQGRVDIVADGANWLLSFCAIGPLAPARTAGAAGVASAPRASLPAVPTALTLEGLLACQIVQLHHGSTHRPSHEEGGGFTLVLPRASAAVEGRA